MRTHANPLFCVIIGLMEGVRFERTFRYDVGEKRYRFKERFTPIESVEITNLGQPVVFGSTTYIFGHDLRVLSEVASAKKMECAKQYKDQITILTSANRRLEETWESVSAVMVKEMATEQSGASIPEAQPSAPSAPVQAEPSIADTGTLPRKVGVYNVYVAAARPEGAGKEEQSAGYCVIVENVTTGEKRRKVRGLGVDNFGRTEALALYAAFLSSIPPSTKELQTIVNIHSRTESIAKMFQSRQLDDFAKNGWKADDGSTIRNSDVWRKVYEVSSRTLTKGFLTLPGEDGDTFMAMCVEAAQKAANEERAARFATD